MKPLPTVNVIDCTNATTCEIQSLASFADDPSGNEAAKDVFVRCVKARAVSITDEDIEIALDEGVYHTDQGYVALIHSTVTAE